MVRHPFVATSCGCFLLRTELQRSDLDNKTLPVERASCVAPAKEEFLPLCQISPFVTSPHSSTQGSRARSCFPSARVLRLLAELY